MKTIGNILWLLTSGLVMGLEWFFSGALWCCTLIGIPFGLQCFKLGKLAFWPFGARVNKNFGAHPVANVIWIIFGGLSLAIGFGFAGVLWCITIIGIPFGKQCFKLAGLALTPFGAEIVRGDAAANVEEKAAA